MELNISNGKQGTQLLRINWGLESDTISLVHQDYLWREGYVEQNIALVDFDSGNVTDVKILWEEQLHKRASGKRWWNYFFFSLKIDENFNMCHKKHWRCIFSKLEVRNFNF